MKNTQLAKVALVLLGVACSVTFVVMNTNSIGGVKGIVDSFEHMMNHITLPLSIEEYSKEEFTKESGNEVDPRDTDKNKDDDGSGPSEDAPTIYVDPGHGGDNNGTQPGGTFENGSGLTEETNNFHIAMKVKSKLESAGYNVKMSRTEAGTKDAIGNVERGKQAAECAAAVCIHSNGTANHSVPGCFNVTDKNFTNYNRTMGDVFLSEMQRNGRQIANNGYFAHDPLQFFRGLSNAGGDTGKVLYVEVGAHDRVEDMDYISSDTGRDQIADCIVSAIKAGVPITNSSSSSSSGSGGGDGTDPQIVRDWNDHAAASTGKTWDQLDAQTKQAAITHWEHMVAQGQPGYTGW